MRRLALAALTGAVVSVGATVVASRAADLGQPAPELSLSDFAGNPVRLQDFRGKRAVLVNFWATWCVPCREEMPTLEQVSRERPDTLVVLGVNLDAVGVNAVRAFVRELKLTFPILLDPKFVAAKAYRVRAIPTSFIVDRSGVVRYREVGYRTWTDAESRYILDDALYPR